MYKKKFSTLKNLKILPKNLLQHNSQLKFQNFYTSSKNDLKVNTELWKWKFIPILKKRGTYHAIVSND